MVIDDQQRPTVDSLVGRRLDTIHDRTGIPIVFGGATHVTPAGTQQVVIDQLVGTVTDAMHGLTVVRGRGLGGTAIARSKPCMVRDYASSTSISHDYDRSVVGQERLTSIVAVPLRLGKIVRGVIYGAVRTEEPIGDRAVRGLVSFVADLERELPALLVPGQRPGDAELVDERTALDELAAIVRATRDPYLRSRLDRIHRYLDRSGRPTGSSAISLTPREIDVLRLVATGATNAEAGRRLGLSPESVKTYVRNAMRKLEVRTRTAAVHVARESGLL
ncbi:response regulator transcription factor [Pseudonocardia tropica]|uniref:Response regulator transcription factor n=1 Tax=Pseudonocardia tropica TaxID=681289 RepID=A0ABV1JXT6_9PSEU